MRKRVEVNHDREQPGIARVRLKPLEREANALTWEADPARLGRAAARPLSASPADVLGLQATIGNRATSRLLHGARRGSPSPAGDGAAAPIQAKGMGSGACGAGTRAGAHREGSRAGLPGGLKVGIEGLSGHSMDDVTVHTNSSAPERIGAEAFTRGTEIHLSPGKERHLPHEAWHVAQQKQGRVKATTQRKGGPVNDDAGLEREADVMGERARRFTGAAAPAKVTSGSSGEGVLQAKWTASVGYSASVNEEVEDGKVFSKVIDEIPITGDETKAEHRVKSGQPTLVIGRFLDEDTSDAPALKWVDLGGGLLQLADGHHRFAAAMVYGHKVSFEDKATAGVQEPDEWTKMTWQAAMKPKADEASERRRQKMLDKMSKGRKKAKPKEK